MCVLRVSGEVWPYFYLARPFYVLLNPYSTFYLTYSTSSPPHHRVYADGIKVNKIDYNDKDFEVKKPALK